MAALPQGSWAAGEYQCLEYRGECTVTVRMEGGPPKAPQGGSEGGRREYPGIDWAEPRSRVPGSENKSDKACDAQGVWGLRTPKVMVTPTHWVPQPGREPTPLVNHHLVQELTNGAKEVEYVSGLHWVSEPSKGSHSYY